MKFFASTRRRHPLCLGLPFMAGAVMLGCTGINAGATQVSAQEASAADLETSALPAVILTDPARLAAVRERVLAGDPELQPALEALIARADAALEVPMRSVTDKTQVPPSGDINDYVSLSPYWWPNPETEDGLPYVRRDGEFNPERDQYDVGVLDNFGNSVVWLGFAYYFTGDERYAENAAARIRHMMMDEATRMNPRMLFGQFIPGVSEGRMYGIIETLRLRWVPDAIAMMADSPAMTDEVMDGARGWFGAYALWLNTSEFGVGERDGPNNHGTWCTAQIAYYSAFAGDMDTVREMSELVPDRIAAQFEPDGRQLEEIARTRGVDYSEFNLRGHTELAVLAEHVGVDLWNFESADGRSLRTGYEFMLPYMSHAEPWPYEQIRDPKEDKYVQSLRRCAIAYNDPRYEAAIEGLIHTTDEAEIFLNLIIPLPEDFPTAE